MITATIKIRNTDAKKRYVLKEERMKETKKNRRKEKTLKKLKGWS
jgi:hypothetical protein